MTSDMAVTIDRDGKVLPIFRCVEGGPAADSGARPAPARAGSASISLLGGLVVGLSCLPFAT